MLKYIIAYFCLIIVWCYLIIVTLEISGQIDLSFFTKEIIFWLIVLPSGYVYHKFKPMSFGEILEKYLNIKLPYFLHWKYIKYKFMILIGTDKEYLDKDEEFSEPNKSK